jgi:hypothetical protein
MLSMIRKVPPLVGILAWSFIGAGALLAVSGVGGLLVAGPMERHPGQNPLFILLGDLPGGAEIWDMLTAWITPASWAQLILALVMTGAGVGLLRLRDWARTTLEWMTWLTLPAVVGYGVFLAVFWFRMVRLMSPDGTAGRSAGGDGSAA